MALSAITCLIALELHSQLMLAPVVVSLIRTSHSLIGRADASKALDVGH